jgi:hypothetical protein
MLSSAEASDLYDRDILLWVKDTVAKLKAGDFAHLDLQHLTEEVEALGIAQQRELLSRLTRLLEHLLKRLYVHSPDNYRGWEITIRNQRSELEILLDKVPSLRTQWSENFEDAWRRSLKKVSKEYEGVTFPETWPYDRSIDFMLDADLW